MKCSGKEQNGWEKICPRQSLKIRRAHQVAVVSGHTYIVLAVTALEPENRDVIQSFSLEQGLRYIPFSTTSKMNK